MENFSEYVNQHQNYYLDLQFKSIQTQHKLNSYSLHTSTFDPSSLKDKYYERCSSFFESEKLFVPKKVKEEYEVILGDAFYLLLSDSAMGLQEISSYISSQVPHLLSVKNKLGELSFEYQEISTFIVKISESEAAGSDLLFQKMTWHATFLNVKSILPESQYPGTLKFQEKSVASHAT